MLLRKLALIALLTLSLPALAQRGNNGVSAPSGVKSLSDTGTSVVSTEPITIPIGTTTLPGLNFAGATNTGLFKGSGYGFGVTYAGSVVADFHPAAGMFGAGIDGASGGVVLSSSLDAGVTRSAAAEVCAGNGSAGNCAGGFKAAAYRSTTNCTSTGGTCTAAPAGAVTIAAAATTVTVATTIVTANSEIFVQEMPAMGVRLGVTCNTTTGRLYTVTTITAGTSFVITSSAAPTTNPACLSFHIVN